MNIIIQRKIYENEYKHPNALFEDMKLVFDNAMKWNKNKKDNKEWYNEAKRLSQILSTLRAKKPLYNIQWIPYDSNKCRYCSDCNNILLSIESAPKRQCNGSCNGNRINFICYNHKNNIRSFCGKCVEKYCNKCNKYHIERKCRTNKTSNGRNTNYDSPKKCSQVPPNPDTVQKYERSDLNGSNVLKRSKMKPNINKEHQTKDNNQETTVKQNIHNTSNPTFHSQYNQSSNNIQPFQQVINDTTIACNNNKLAHLCDHESRVEVNNNYDNIDKSVGAKNINLFDQRSNIQNLNGNNNANNDEQTYKAFQILGLKTDATQTQIDKAFRNLARQNHPDKIHKILEERMSELNGAYAICKMQKQGKRIELRHQKSLKARHNINYSDNHKQSHIIKPGIKEMRVGNHFGAHCKKQIVSELTNQNKQTFERKNNSLQTQSFSPISQTIIKPNIRHIQKQMQQITLPNKQSLNTLNNSNGIKNYNNNYVRALNNGIKQKQSYDGRRKSEDEYEGEGNGIKCLILSFLMKLLMIIVIIAFIIEMLFTV